MVSIAVTDQLPHRVEGIKDSKETELSLWQKAKWKKREGGSH